MKDAHHGVYFITLSFILIVGFSSFYLAMGNTGLQLTIGLATIASYFIWGNFYHYVRNDLHPKVILEYALIGIISGVILFTILQ